MMMGAAAEKIEISYFDDAANRYAVPKRQWAKWGKAQRRVFNYVHSAMIRNPDLFQHPSAYASPRKAFAQLWKTIAWNAAWEAACAAE
jgi:hypothetical protein